MNESIINERGSQCARCAALGLDIRSEGIQWVSEELTRPPSANVSVAGPGAITSGDASAYHNEQINEQRAETVAACQGARGNEDNESSGSAQSHAARDAMEGNPAPASYEDGSASGSNAVPAPRFSCM